MITRNNSYIFFFLLDKQMQLESMSVCKDGRLCSVHSKPEPLGSFRVLRAQAAALVIFRHQMHSRKVPVLAEYIKNIMLLEGRATCQKQENTT